MLNIGRMTRAGKVVGRPHRVPDASRRRHVRRQRSEARSRQLTAVNDDILAGKKLGEVKEIWYTGPEGLQDSGLDHHAARLRRRRRSTRCSCTSMADRTACTASASTSRGRSMRRTATSCCTRTRAAAPGYGSAFGNAIKNAYPSKDFDDLMAGVDELLKKGYVDERNMFVYGCSGGGVLTAWVVGHTDRFAAASSQVPGHRLGELRRHDRRHRLVSTTSRSCPGRTRPSTSVARRSCTSATSRRRRC